MKKCLWSAALGLGILCLAGSDVRAQDAKGQLREKLKDTALQGAWVYDDIDAGFAEAKKTGKPLLVVFR